MAKNNIINLDEHIKRRQEEKRIKECYCKNKCAYGEEVERLKTLNLFMKVLATMKKESF